MADPTGWGMMKGSFSVEDPMNAYPDITAEDLIKPNGWTAQIRKLQEVHRRTPGEAIQALCEMIFEWPGANPPLEVSAPVLIALQTMRPSGPGAPNKKQLIENYDHMYRSLIHVSSLGIAGPAALPQAGDLPLIATLWLVGWRWFDREEFANLRTHQRDWPDELAGRAAPAGVGIPKDRLLEDATSALKTLADHPAQPVGTLALSQGLCRAYVVWATADIYEETHEKNRALFMKAVRTGQVHEYKVLNGDARAIQDVNLTLLNLIQKPTMSSPSEKLGRLVDVLAFLQGTRITPADHAQRVQDWLAKGAALDPKDPLHDKRQAALRDRHPAFHAQLREHAGLASIEAPALDVRRRRRSPT